jgi:long-chain acyl-CoA synthetase
MKEKIWQKKYDKGVPVSIPFSRITLDQLLEKTCRHFPGRTALLYENCKLSYRDVWRSVVGMASKFIKYGLKRSQPVLLLLPNCPQFVICYYAVLRAGGVVVATNPRYTIDEIQSQIKQTGVRWVICAGYTIEKILSIRTPCKIEKIIVVDLTEGSKGKNKPYRTNEKQEYIVNYEDLIRVGSKIVKGRSRYHQPAVLQFSGGTTGTPKAAVGLHRNLVANTIQFRSWLKGLHEGKEVVLAAIPLFHVYGMVIAMSLGIYLGATIVLISDARDTQAIVKAIDRWHITLFPGVPNMYYSIINLPKQQLEGLLLTSIKACISGSAPLSPLIKRGFEQMSGGKLMEGYGLSEAPTATHCNPMFGENREGSIGLPLPGVDCQVVDVDSGKKELPIGQPGELIIRGPQVMQGYYHDRLETKKTIRKGWLYTGDIARMDADGYFYLAGRKKELIKVGGFQVWPNEIEEVLMKCGTLQEVAVAGVQDKRGSEEIIAWIVRKAGSRITAKDLRDWCKSRLVDYKVPRRIFFSSALPRSTVGKILKRKLTEGYRNKKSDPM